MRALLTAIAAALVGFAAGSWRAPRGEETTAPLPTPIAGGNAAHDAVVTAADAAGAPPAPAVDSRPVRDRLREAARSRNPLGKAAQAQALIANLTLEDFRELASQPKEFPFPNSFGMHAIFGRAFMDAIVRRWREVDPEGAVAAMLALDEALVISREGRTTSVRFGHGQFPEALARARPATIAEALAGGARFNDYGRAGAEAFVQLAQSDSRRARALAERIPDANDRRRVMFAIERATASEPDPVRRAATAHDSRTISEAFAAAARQGPVQLRATLEATTWKISCASLVAEAVMRNPDEPWETLPPELAGKPGGNLEAGSAQSALTLARALPPKDRERAITAAERLQGAWRAPALSPLIAAWAAAEPTKAIEWVAQRTDRGEFALTALGPWLVSDSAAAIAWAEKSAPESVRQALSGQLAQALASAAEEAAAKSTRPLFFPSLNSGTEAIADALIEKSPSTAAQWISSLPRDQPANREFKPVFEAWVQRDADAAASWLTALPESRRRDEAAAAFTIAAAKRDAQGAAEWVSTIGDKPLRQSAAEGVFRALDARDPVAARAWLRGVAGVDEKWRARLLEPSQ